VAEQTTKTEATLKLLQEHGILRPRDLASHDIPLGYLDRLYRRGLVDRVARGLYGWPNADLTEHHSLVEAARLVPKGVVCLLSALEFHGVTTQSPHEVWLVLPGKAWVPKATSPNPRVVRGGRSGAFIGVGRGPKVAYPKLRIVRASGSGLTGMVEEHRIEGVDVKVYSLAKTIADCFKYRSKVGLDVALEALRDALRQRRVTIDELCDAASVCRVENVMRPYLESLA